MQAETTDTAEGSQEPQVYSPASSAMQAETTDTTEGSQEPQVQALPTTTATSGEARPLLLAYSDLCGRTLMI